MAWAGRAPGRARPELPGVCYVGPSRRTGPGRPGRTRRSSASARWGRENPREDRLGKNFPVDGKREVNASCGSGTAAPPGGEKPRKSVKNRSPTGRKLPGGGNRRGGRARAGPGRGGERSRRGRRCRGRETRKGPTSRSTPVCGRFPEGRASLTVLLDARRPEAGETMAVDRMLPGQEFLDGQGIAIAGFLERQ